MTYCKVFGRDGAIKPVRNKRIIRKVIEREILLA